MDKLTFEQKILACEQALYRISKSLLKNDTECEDAVSAAILKAYEKLHTVKDESVFQTWVVRILINECYNILRKRHGSLDIDECVDIAADNVNDYSELYTAITRLKPQIRIVIVLHYIEGYSVEDVQTILAIPKGTVKSRLFTGRKALKNLLSEQEEL